MLCRAALHQDKGFNEHVDRRDIGRKWATLRFGKGSFTFIVAASVCAFWLLVSLIPLYNKYFFQKTLYPYPLATAGIQLSIVSLMLISSNVFQHYFDIRKRICNKLDCGAENESASVERSWIFDVHLLWKLKWVFPAGFLFGLKYGVTNLGLHLVPAPTHLLLQSTDLIWTLLGAWLINGERVTKIGLVCLSGCIVGSAILSMRLGQSLAAPLPAIAVNLLSPVLLGLCITTLRVACAELMCQDNRVGGSVTPSELTALKLAISATVAILMAFIFERGRLSEDGEHTILSWESAFSALPYATKLGVVGGAVPILIFQVNCTFLTFLTSAVGVGLVGQLKIIPQWIAAALVAPSADFHLVPANIIGALVTMMSAAAFAIHNWLAFSNREMHVDCCCSSAIPSQDGTTSLSSDNSANSTECEGLLSVGQRANYQMEDGIYHSIDDGSNDKERRLQ